MSKYDFDLAKKTIQKYSDLLESATLGMAEDWFWTAEEVYYDKKFTKVLDENTEIGGINGSQWATPTLLLVFKDGSEKFLDCYVGDIDRDKKPAWFSLGCLSSACQDAIDVKLGKYIN